MYSVECGLQLTMVGVFLILWIVYIYIVYFASHSQPMHVICMAPSDVNTRGVHTYMVVMPII